MNLVAEGEGEPVANTRSSSTRRTSAASASRPLRQGPARAACPVGRAVHGQGLAGQAAVAGEGLLHQDMMRRGYRPSNARARSAPHDQRWSGVRVPCA